MIYFIDSCKYLVSKHKSLLLELLSNCIRKLCYNLILSGIKDLTCSKDNCTKSFRTVSQLNEHIRGHENGFGCQFCNKSYKSRSALKSHQQKHTEETIQNKCTICAKDYNSKNALKMHERSHSNQIPSHKMASLQNKITPLNVPAQKSTESSNQSAIYYEEVI